MSEASELVSRSVALERAYVHQVYEQISDAPDPASARVHKWPRVKQFLSDLEPGSLVCDVGCGNGKYLDINPSVFNVGVDRCQRLTEVAREKDNEVLISDNLALPFRDESFDAVLSIAVVHHFATTDRRVAALRELARVLRIGGRLIITVWAMERKHRKFESQDVLVPWRRPQQDSTPSLELVSTATNTSEEEGFPPYHAYTQSSDSDSASSQRRNNGERKKGRHKGRSIDPNHPISNSSSHSSLSSPETCFSILRRAMKKLTHSKKRGDWLMGTWNSCTQEPSCHNHDPDGCENVTVEEIKIQDLPIELRRLDEETDLPARRQTFAYSARMSTSLENSMGHKSKSLTDILSANQGDMVRSRSSVPYLETCATKETADVSLMENNANTSATSSQPKPRLVKQKTSLCEEEMEDEGGDQPTDMRDLVNRLPDFKVSIAGGNRRNGGFFKQSSMNEELMFRERLNEKERVRQNIQKQASLNEEFLFQRQRKIDSIRDTFFSTSTAKRLQLLKNGLTNKIKSSTTGIEKVTGASFKNGFARILQGWKGDVPAQQAKPPPTPPPRSTPSEERNGNGTALVGERRPSKEDGSDSSKDSSLQSDTSVDSEDSFASVIFIPKPDQTSPPINTSPTAGLPSPQPTSPKFKYQSPTSPIIKQPSLPSKYPGPTSPNFKPTKQNSLPTSPKFKFQIPPLSPSFLMTTDPLPKLVLQHTPNADVTSPIGKVEISPTLGDMVNIIEKVLPQVEAQLEVTVPVKIEEPHVPREPPSVPTTDLFVRPGTGRHAFPLVRRCESLAIPGRSDMLAKPLPKLLSLELFNPETDDSDSSGLSSPDSISSVISVLTEELSACSQDIQQAKPSPSEGQSTSTSTNDSDLNLSDQSISSLPNCKSPEVTLSKSPELLSRSPEALKSSDSTSSESNRLDVKGTLKPARSPENLSSSSESLSKSLEPSKEESAKQKPKVPERVSSRSPEILKIKAQMHGRDVKTILRKRDEKFVMTALETVEEPEGRSCSPSNSLLEAVADVASSLEGAVDAVIQSSPRARRRQLDSVDAMRIVEGELLTHSSPEREDEILGHLFKKCDRKRSPEHVIHDEPYPDFEFCRTKQQDIENIPLLSSFEQESETESESSKRERRRADNSSPGSCWSLGRSERLHQLETQRRQKYSGTWSLHRSERRVPERPIVRIIREDMSVEEEPYLSLRQRRNVRSHSLSLYNTERPQGPWEENQENPTEMTTEKVLQRVVPEPEGSDVEDQKHFSASLPAGLELMDDPYLIKINEGLSDLSRLTAELHERNNYLASLSDEDLSRELKRTQKNPFIASGTDESHASPNPFSSQVLTNPFLTESTIDPFTFDGSEAVQIGSSLTFDDSFVPLEVDSPPQMQQTENLSATQVQRVENVAGITGENTVKSQDVVTKIILDTEFVVEKESFNVPLNIQRKPSIITTEITEEGEIECIEQSDSLCQKRHLGGTSGHSMESSDPDGSDGSKKGSSRGLSRDSSRMTIASSQGHSMESNDPDGSSDSSKKDSSRGLSRDSSRMTIGSSQGHSMESNDPEGSDGSRKDAGRGIPRDTSCITIASSLGHSMDSSDPDASEWSRRETSRVTTSNASMGHSLESSDLGDVSDRTGSGSDLSRKETSSAGTGVMEDSCTSLGQESGSDCSKELRYIERGIMRGDGCSSSGETTSAVKLVRQKASIHEPDQLPITESVEETSVNSSGNQESSPSDGGGDSISFHRYYHVFREGELDQLIEKYIENLHIISSYYDRANWCVIAEKVHVWTI